MASERRFLNSKWSSAHKIYLVARIYFVVVRLMLRNGQVLFLIQHIGFQAFAKRKQEQACGSALRLYNNRLLSVNS